MRLVVIGVLTAAQIHNQGVVMATFSNVIDFVLGHEMSSGKTLLDNPKTGELSNFGITGPFLLAFNPDALKASGLRGLTKPQAIQTYQNFFNQLGLASIASDRVAAKYFDMCINMGSIEATRLLQLSVNTFGTLVAVDGKFGHTTENAVNTVTKNLLDGEDKLLAEIVKRSTSFYKSIATGPKAEYLSAWLARASDIPKEV